MPVSNPGTAMALLIYFGAARRCGRALLGPGSRISRNKIWPRQSWLALCVRVLTPQVRSLLTGVEKAHVTIH